MSCARFDRSKNQTRAAKTAEDFPPPFEHILVFELNRDAARCLRI
jgi:hypothetical protein